MSTVISLLKRLLAQLEARAERRQKRATARQERQWREHMPETAKLVDGLEAHNRALLDSIIADENEVRDWTLVLFDAERRRHELPLRCSRRQIRRAKIAVAEAGGDALALERSVPVARAKAPQALASGDLS